MTKSENPMSTEKVVRYTAEQMLQHADYLESPLSAPAYGECMRMASMLRQAAQPAEQPRGEARSKLEPDLVDLIAGLRRHQVVEAVKRLLDYIDTTAQPKPEQAVGDGVCACGPECQDKGEGNCRYAPRPAVSTPNPAKEMLGILKGWHEDGPAEDGVTDDEIVRAIHAVPELDKRIDTGDKAEIAFAAYRLALASRPVEAAEGRVMDEDSSFDDIEQVAQWLYRKGMHNASFVVREQVDIRNNIIRDLRADLANPHPAVAYDIEKAARDFCEEGCEGNSGTYYPTKDGAWFLTQLVNGLPVLYATQPRPMGGVPEVDFTVEEVESAIENVREYNRLMPSECIDQMRDVLLLAAAPEVDRG